MSKPVTSVAAMILYEEGGFELTDPVSRYIPAFADVRVFAGGSDVKPLTVPAAEPIRIWHLLTHTSGLTYGFLRVHPVDAIYRAAGFEWGSPRDLDLAGCCEAWAGLPLLFEPGTEWNYSVVHRRARPPGRGGVRAEPGPVPGRAGARPAGHDRHGLLGRRRPGAPAGPALHARPGPGPPGRAHGRLRQGGLPVTAVPQRRGRPGAPRPPTTTASPRCCWTGRTARRASWTASGC